MKMKLLPLFVLPVFAGCLSSAPKAPTNWTVDFSRSKESVKISADGESLRISYVDVQAPYSGQRLVVLRPDGTLAFDAYNVFASSPALLLRGVAYDAISSSTQISYVVPADSSAKTKYELELIVTELALDCRVEGKRTARVALAALVLEGRNVVATSRGVGAMEAGDDFSVAFSTAFVRALNDAFVKADIR